jgi:CheY-like chemotaxis protein
VGAREKKALVVNDDVAIRILVTKILGRHGFAVDAVPDGAAAIERLTQHEYAVVVLDLMMPRIDGFGVIRYISDHNPGLFERLIVMTAFGASAEQHICPPVVRFIHKPFDVDRLLDEAVSAASGD